MSETFDPYYKWLGIPPGEQPPNLYRLLGVNRFESDPEVLESAAEQRINHLRTFQGGPHAEESQRLLNELASAKLRLLKPKRKFEYDNDLRVRMTWQPPAVVPPNGWRAPFPPQELSRSTSNGDARPTVLPASAPGVVAAATLDEARDNTIELEDLGITPPSVISPNRRASMPPVLWIAGPAIFVILLVVTVLQMSVARNHSERREPIAALQRPLSVAPQAKRPTVQMSPDAGSRAAVGLLARSDAGSNRGATAVDSQQNDETSSSGLADRDSLKPPSSPENGSAAFETQPREAPVASGNRSEPPVERTDPFAAIPPSGDDAPHNRAERDKTAAPRRLPAAVRAIVPSEIAQQDALREIRNILRDEFVAATTRPLQVALARKLDRLAADTPDDAAARYVLRSQALDLAIRAGDVNLSAELADRLAQSFDVDAWPPRLKAWSRLPQFLSSPENRTLFVRHAVQFANDAVAEDRYETAVEFSALAINAAAAVKDRSIRDNASDCADRTKHMQTAAATASAAIETLLCDPTNPQANLTVGKFRCFDKQEWVRGLPYLARGSDAALRELARRELHTPTGSPEQLKLADAWWDLAEKSGESRSGNWRSPLHARGIQWYREAMPALSGLALVKAQKRASAGANSDDQTP
jgi:hypothetical protein